MSTHSVISASSNTDAEGISIIIPTFNEYDSLSELVGRIDRSMHHGGRPYELIVIDDRSEDGTFDLALSFQKSYPLRVFQKKGRRGKAFSLLEGFAHARYRLCSFIDADLQYPPEAIEKMACMVGPTADIVVAERKERDTSFIRVLTSKSFRLICGTLLHRLDCDVQSGLKVFRTEIVRNNTYSPTPWTFDLEFLIRARNAGYKIATYGIVFSERKHGYSKVHLLKTSYEIAAAALRVKFMTMAPRV